MKYQLISGRHSRIEGGARKSYARGDEIDLTPLEVRSFGDRVRPLGESALFAHEPSRGVDLLDYPDLVAEISGLTAPKVFERLEVADRNEVERIRTAELAGNARKGVLKAIAARLEELGAA